MERSCGGAQSIYRRFDMNKRERKASKSPTGNERANTLADHQQTAQQQKATVLAALPGRLKLRQKPSGVELVAIESATVRLGDRNRTVGLVGVNEVAPRSDGAENIKLYKNQEDVAPVGPWTRQNESQSNDVGAVEAVKGVQPRKVGPMTQHEA